jgi:hypothetical protein
VILLVVAVHSPAFGPRVVWPCGVCVCLSFWGAGDWPDDMGDCPTIWRFTPRSGRLARRSGRLSDDLGDCPTIWEIGPSIWEIVRRYGRLAPRSGKHSISVWSYRELMWLCVGGDRGPTGERMADG